MGETLAELRIRLANYQALHQKTQEHRRQAVAAGNHALAGKLHQAEREWRRRIAELERKIADLQAQATAGPPPPAGS